MNGLAHTVASVGQIARLGRGAEGSSAGIDGGRDRLRPRGRHGHRVVDPCLEGDEAVFLDEVLGGSGWQVDRVRSRGTRLNPPDSYWSLFSVDINKDGEERSLRLVAKGALNPEAWETLSTKLTVEASDQPYDPIDGVGYPRLFPETQHAFWFYPFDPSMPNLPLANDPVRMAAVLLGEEANTTDILATAGRLGIERVDFDERLGDELYVHRIVLGPVMIVLGEAESGADDIVAISRRAHSIGG